MLRYSGLQQVHVDGSKLDTLSKPGASTTVTAENGDMVNAVGVNDGTETVVSQLVADSDTTSSGSGPEVVYDSPPSSDPSDSAPSDLNTMLNDMEGDGSASNPYIIMDDHNLQAMRADVGGHYNLGQDIDASATGLTTSEMQGASAKSNMDFDFSESGKWETVEGEYPVLRALDKEEQLRHRE